MRHRRPACILSLRYVLLNFAWANLELKILSVYYHTWLGLKLSEEGMCLIALSLLFVAREIMLCFHSSSVSQQSVVILRPPL